MVACLVRFLCSVFFLDLIGFLVLLGWSMSGRSGLCPLGLSCDLFYILRVRNWQFSWFRRLWFVVLGVCPWGYGIGSGSFFMGGR